MLTTALNKGGSSKRFPFRLAASSALLLLASVQFGCGRPFSVKTQPKTDKARWLASYEAAIGKHPERKQRFSTLSDLPVDPLQYLK